MVKLNVSRFDSIEGARKYYLRQADNIAYEAVGVLSGAQAMAYNEKHREALAYGSNEATPWIEEEAEALGITPHEVAESILRAKSLWDCRCRRIESYRVSAKRDIRLADEIREMAGVIGSLNTQIESLNSETK